jgi:transcription antitermination factor NusA-like protein
VTLTYAEELWLTQGTPCTYGRRWPMVKLNHILRDRMKEKNKVLGYEDKHILITRRTKEPVRRCIKNWGDMFKGINEKFPNEKIEVFDDKNETFDR